MAPGEQELLDASSGTVTTLPSLPNEVDVIDEALEKLEEQARRLRESG